MMMNNLFLLALSSSVTASSIHGAVIVQSGTVTSGPSSEDHLEQTTFFTFSQFDPSIGILQSVELRTFASSFANVEVDNESSEGASASTSLYSWFHITTPHLEGHVILVNGGGGVLLSPDNDEAPDFIGSDSHDFGWYGDTNYGGGLPPTSDDLSPYIGLGTVEGRIYESSARFVISYGIDNEITDSVIPRFSNGQTEATWTIIYNYDAIPEPNSFVAIGLCFVGMSALRRR